MSNWLHYIGGFYTPKKFIEEAKNIGVSRRVPANLIKSMSWGDTITLAYWNEGNPYAFAEFSLDGISLDSDLTDLVGNELVKAGRATVSSGGGGRIVRGCGTYESSGTTFIVDASIREIAERATDLAEDLDIKPSFFINGRITCIYDQRRPLPGEKFFRGYKRLEHSIPEPAESQHLHGIDDYAKRQRRNRIDIQMQLFNQVVA